MLMCTLLQLYHILTTCVRVCMAVLKTCIACMPVRSVKTTHRLCTPHTIDRTPAPPCPIRIAMLETGTMTISPALRPPLHARYPAGLVAPLSTTTVVRAYLQACFRFIRVRCNPSTQGTRTKCVHSCLLASCVEQGVSHVSTVASASTLSAATCAVVQ